jgi:hypothetical protein
MAARSKVGFDIVVRFRKRRLWLFRNIPTLPEAQRIARRLQQERFHDPDAVSVIDAVTGAEHAVIGLADGDGGADPREGSRSAPPPGPRLHAGGADGQGSENDDRSRRDPEMGRVEGWQAGARERDGRSQGS